MILFNATAQTIEVRSFKHRYQISAGKAAEVTIDPLFGNHPFVIQSEGRVDCYAMARVDQEWIRPGKTRAVANALLDARGHIFVLPKDIQLSDDHLPLASTQPKDFPLVPTKHELCGSLLEDAMPSK